MTRHRGQFEPPRNRQDRRQIARLNLEKHARDLGVQPEPGEMSSRLQGRILDAQHPSRKRDREAAQALYGKGSELYWVLHRATNGFLPPRLHVIALPSWLGPVDPIHIEQVAPR